MPACYWSMSERGGGVSRDNLTFACYPCMTDILSQTCVCIVSRITLNQQISKRSQYNNKCKTVHYNTLYYAIPIPILYYTILYFTIPYIILHSNIHDCQS